MIVSIIVPCRNEARHISPFLESVIAQTAETFDIEIIVADGMSDDGTRELLQAWTRRDTRIRVIDNTRKIVSTGLNAAIRCARGEIVLRMDVHAEYAPDYVASCIAVLQATGADNVGGAPRIRTRSFRERLFGAAFHSPFAVGGSRFHNPDYEGAADTVCFGAWRKETLERIGLFDESLVRNQDDELNYRILLSGGRLWQSRSIVSWYVPRCRLDRLAKQYFQYGFWKVAVIRKHGRPASPRHLAPAIFVSAVALLPSLAAGLAAAGATRTTRALLLCWLALVTAYAMACLAAALTGSRKQPLAVLAALPFIFPVYHFSYGTGFLYGLFRAVGTGGATRNPDAVISLSR